MRIRWYGNVAQFNCGYTIDPRKWDSNSSRCKKNTFNSKQYSASEINKELNKLEELAQDTFKSFEVQERIPSLQEYKDTFNTLNGKNAGVRNDARFFKNCFTEFTSTEGSANSWADGTYLKLATLQKHLSSFQKEIVMDDFKEDFFLRFIEYLRDQVGLQNTSIIKTWRNLHWFLKWADRKGYLKNKDYQSFKLRLKTVTDKEVIFLT